MKTGVSLPSAIFCITPRPRHSARRPTLMMGCGAPGTGPAATKRSARVTPRACRCSLRSMASWALKAVSVTYPIAATLAASPIKTATGLICIAAAASRTDRPAATAAVLAAPNHQAVAAAKVAGMAAAETSPAAARAIFSVARDSISSRNLTRICDAAAAMSLGPVLLLNFSITSNHQETIHVARRNPRYCLAQPSRRIC